MPDNKRLAGSLSSPAHLQILCTQYVHAPKNTRLGFCTLSFPAAYLEISGCSYNLRSDGKYWIGLPSRYENGKWIPIVSAISRDQHFHVQHVAVKAVQKYLDSLHVLIAVTAKPEAQDVPL